MRNFEKAGMGADADSSRRESIYTHDFATDSPFQYQFPSLIPALRSKNHRHALIQDFYLPR
jgi:hypothetical protein